MAADTRDPVRDQRTATAVALRKHLDAAIEDEARYLEDAEMVSMCFRQTEALQHLPHYDAAADGTALRMLEERQENDEYGAAYHREEAGLISRFLAVVEQLLAEGDE